MNSEVQKSYAAAKSAAQNLKTPFHLTLAEYTRLKVRRACCVCGHYATPKNPTQLELKDKALGFVFANVEVYCKTCKFLQFGIRKGYINEASVWEWVRRFAGRPVEGDDDGGVGPDYEAE